MMATSITTKSSSGTRFFFNILDMPGTFYVVLAWMFMS